MVKTPECQACGSRDTRMVPIELVDLTTGDAYDSENWKCNNCGYRFGQEDIDE